MQQVIAFVLLFLVLTVAIGAPGLLFGFKWKHCLRVGLIVAAVFMGIVAATVVAMTLLSESL